MNDNRIINLLKKPANGGIPATENKPSEKLITKTKFFKPADVQLDK